MGETEGYDKESMTPQASDYFSRMAEQWDDVRAGYFGEAVREAAMAKAGLQPDWEVADVGTGTGFVAHGLAARVRKVYGLDASTEMLAVARRNLAAFDNVELRHCDGAALVLPDRSVDAVLANMYLHHCPDPLAAIREMTRLLRPGGRLVITDADQHDHEWMRAEMADVWLGFDRQQVRAWFTEAGLRDVEVDCTGSDCCATSEHGTAAAISIFVASGTKTT